jgi:ankyrin repeat protein
MKNGADIKLTNDKHQTALTVATNAGNQNMVRLLLESVNMPDYIRQKTMLDYMRICSYNYHLNFP